MKYINIKAIITEKSIMPTEVGINRLIKNKIGFSNSMGIAGKIHKLNTAEGSFPAIDKELMSDIGQFFAYDLDLLSSLIKRNLSDWRYNK